MTKANALVSVFLSVFPLLFLTGTIVYPVIYYDQALCVLLTNPCDMKHVSEPEM